MSLPAIVSQYRHELLRHESQAEQKIRLAHSHMLTTVQPHLEQLYSQLKDAQSSGEKVPLHWLYEGNRLLRTKRVIKQSVNQFGASAKVQVLRTQHQAVALGAHSAGAQIATASGHSAHMPSHASTQKLVGVSHTGKPIDTLMDGFGDEASDKAGKALIAGVSLGQKQDTISRAIMAALVICLWRSLTVDRTSMMDAYRGAFLITAQLNDDTAQLWEWKASPGACPFCASMDGTRHAIDEEMQSHPNCRCQMQIVTA
jgi:hypothetical protein